MFRAPTGCSGKREGAILEKKVYNAIKVGIRIGDHPDILQVQVFDDENIVVVRGFRWSDVGTLRDYLDNARPDRRRLWLLPELS